MIRIALLGLLALSNAAYAEETDPAAAFGARNGIESIALSPDGTQVAFIAPQKGKGNGLYVVPVDKKTLPRRIADASGDPEVLRSCDWVSNTRLVCLLSSGRRNSGWILSGSRYIAMNSDATQLKPLSGGLVDMLVSGPANNILVGYSGNNFPSSVYRLDTLTGRSVFKLSGLRMGTYFLSDGDGEVRIAGAMTEDGNYQGKIYKFMFRKLPEDRWVALSQYDIVARSGFRPVAVDGKANLVYGLQGQDGRVALSTIALDDSKTQKLILARPDVDVDGVVTLGRRSRVVGASYVTDRRQMVYFDPELSKLRRSLGPLFPGSQIDFVGASDDEKRLLVEVSSDKAPGTFYVFDKATKHLENLILARPELANVPLAAVQSVQVTATDGTPIPAYLTMPTNGPRKNIPAIVMPHGGPEARDELGFDWLAQYFVSRGYAVIQPNFRGSTGYGDSWFIRNGFQSWPTAIGDIADSGRWLVKQGIADPGRLFILGWSYGGYAALQAQVAAPGLFKATVAIAPVTDLTVLKNESINYYGRYVEAERIGGGPVAEAGSPARHAAAFTSPVLMFHGDIDENVAVKESRMMDDRLRNAGKSTRLVIYPGLDHQLADSAARADMLRQADAFFRQNSGANPGK